MDIIFDLIAEGLFSASEEVLKDKSASKIKKRAAAVFLLTALLAVTGLFVFATAVTFRTKPLLSILLAVVLLAFCIIVAKEFVKAYRKNYKS